MISLTLLLILDPALAGDRQGVLVQTDLHVFASNLRQLSLDEKLVLVLEDIYSRGPRADGSVTVHTATRVLEQPIDAPLEIEHFAERIHRHQIPKASHGHHLCSSLRHTNL